MSGKIELVLIFEKVIFHVLVYWQMLVRWNDGVSMHIRALQTAANTFKSQDRSRNK
ncbi:hypothetical protein SNOG_07408 [Parastagonospora nodorum SN15]|uniref:Uncharacterized protein n=1 Tax=Phaeosphaeria nodorum (strain SN15 / ATCC MYA-4574 / FGSC 10173) TaxID=321614 RepID=Q0ULF6_PHANO|nr:hypothetical protein SNOG_07408 [Parastagonospora nodorum SN15]EAT84874.1 hypothetical protein SNOG_07408 [Parastagonospora nodorum SN15]